MKISGLPIQTHTPGHTGVPTRASQSVNLSTPVGASSENTGPYSGRPVRINRAEEEAALFAYTKQAQLNLHKPDATVDEYV